MEGNKVNRSKKDRKLDQDAFKNMRVQPPCYYRYFRLKQYGTVAEYTLSLSFS